MLLPALQLKDIAKSYRDIIALDDVSLDIAPGSIHGIVGENGAGKSTLLKIAYGLFPPDKGAIYVDGVPVNITTPQDARRQGIGMLHQTTSWLEKHSIIENILLGDGKFRLFSRIPLKSRQTLTQLCREFGFSFSLDTPMAQLDFSQRQLVDILRSLYRGAKILILDEPMALLSLSQSTYLYDLLKLLKKQGVSIVIVAHKLAILHKLCDVITVMKEGRILSQISPEQVSLKALSKLMVGREITLPHPSARLTEKRQQPLLVVENLAVSIKETTNLNTVVFDLSDIDLSVQSHEIVALIGLPKAGHEKLLEVLAGSVPFHDGNIVFKQRKYNAKNYGDIKGARTKGISYVPDPLTGVALVNELPIYESALLGIHHTDFYAGEIFSDNGYKKHCYQLMQSWHITPCMPDLLTGAFSGGNQQKMVLAREISTNPDLLLLNQPSNGVDVGALESIYQRLFSLREQGTSIIFCTNDLDEVMSLSDRVILFERGRMIGQYYTKYTTKNVLSLILANEVMSV